jgi:thioredoxin reductase (NADPH)
VPGEIELRGKGIIESGVRDKASWSGKRVVIVGGGDAAVENALMISRHAASVKLVHRRSELTARSEFLRELSTRTNVEMIFNTVVNRIIGNSQVSGVELKDVSTGDSHVREIDGVLIRIGVAPNTEFVRDLVDLDDRGYIKVDAVCETNVTSVYAVGDVANPVSPTLNTAAGMGATAAKAVHSLIKISRNGL